MDQLSALKTFAQVAEATGFTAAAAALGQSKSAVSREIAALEEKLGVQLFKRSTRTVALTEAGYAYLERVRNILTELDEANSAVAALHTQPRGQLKVNAPLSFGVSHIGPAVADFLAVYQEVDVSLILNDRPVDPLEDGFDVTIRIAAELASSSLSARRIGAIEMGIYAAPQYLAKAGRPRSPEDLTSHAALQYGHPAPQHVWHLRGGGGEVAIPLQARLCSNNGDVLRTAALAGQGITLLPSFFVREDVKAGRLAAILDGFEPKSLGLFILYPPTRFLAAKTRVFIDFLAQRFRSLPI